MTAEQLLVLALLAAAFAVGWVARRGSGRDEARERLSELLGDARSAIDRAMTAYRVARGVAGADPAAASEARSVLGTVVAALESESARLANELGADHPLAEDCAQVVTALSLLGDELAQAAGGAALDERALRPVETAAREAQTRFARTTTAVLSLAPSPR